MSDRMPIKEYIAYREGLDQPIPVVCQVILGAVVIALSVACVAKAWPV